jgi:uroporphyrinogen decarboxylase
MQQIINGLVREHEGQRIPVILFTKGGCQWLEIMADTGCDALGIDWSTDLAAARKRVGKRVALQGNLDPAVLYAGPEVIREKVADVLARFGPGSGHVFNLGHGITPDVNPEHAGILVDAVHNLSKPYHL